MLNQLVLLVHPTLWLVTYKYKVQPLQLDTISHQELLLLAQLGLLLVSMLPVEPHAGTDITLQLMQLIVLLAHHLQLFALQQLSSKSAWEDITQLQSLETKFHVLLAQLLTMLSIVTTHLMLLHAQLDIAQLMEFAQDAQLTLKTVLEPLLLLALNHIILLTILVLLAHQELLLVLVQSLCLVYQDMDWSEVLVLLALAELRLVHPLQSLLHVIQDSHYQEVHVHVPQDMLHQALADLVLLAHLLAQLAHHLPFVLLAQVDTLYQALDLAQSLVLHQITPIKTDLVLLAHPTVHHATPLDVLPVALEVL